MKVESQNSTVCAISVPGINDPAQTVSRTRKFTEKQTFSQRNNLRENNFLLSPTDMTQFSFQQVESASFIWSFNGSFSDAKVQFVAEILTFWKDVLLNVFLWCMIVCQLQVKTAKNCQKSPVWQWFPLMAATSPESILMWSFVICPPFHHQMYAWALVKQCRILLEPRRTMAWLDGKV